MGSRIDMDSISTVVAALVREQQAKELSVTDNGMVLLNGRHYQKDQVSLIKTFRFEWETDPAEQAIIYLFRTYDGSVGYAMDSYSIYNDHNNDGFSNFIDGVRDSRD